MRAEELIHLIVNTTRSYNSCKKVKMIIRPSKGWLYEIHCDITDIVIEPTANAVFISNAFSSKDCYGRNISGMLNVLRNRPEYYVAFEVYGWSGKSNRQILTEVPKIENVSVQENDDCFVFIINTESI